MTLTSASENRALQRVCRLCLNSKVLRRSHVIPEFLFKPCYDKRHRMLQLDRRPNRPRYQQKGWREHLLCDDCEQFLNTQYEQPAKSQWLDAPKLPLTVRATPLTIQGLDYKTFKLFHLSVLWRAAVATSADFAQVRLGPHEERIRKMLRHQDPGEPSQYPVFAAVLLLPQSSSPAYDVVMPPSAKKIDGQPLYQTVYGGCVWEIAGSKSRASIELEYANAKPYRSAYRYRPRFSEVLGRWLRFAFLRQEPATLRLALASNFRCVGVTIRCGTLANFTLKLVRPGFGPAAELPTSLPA